MKRSMEDKISCAAYLMEQRWEHETEDDSGSNHQAMNVTVGYTIGKEEQGELDYQ